MPMLESILKSEAHVKWVGNVEHALACSFMFSNPPHFAQRELVGQDCILLAGFQPASSC